jgi:hypothetical protein
MHGGIVAVEMDQQRSGECTLREASHSDITQGLSEVGEVFFTMRRILEQWNNEVKSLTSGPFARCAALPSPRTLRAVWTDPQWALGSSLG